jgi:predicted metal-dependent phosphoesterase TrpH
MKYVDLHVHSTKSDGSYEPYKVVELAKKAGLSAITLSDHDSVAGLKEAEEKADELGIEFIKGIEITCLHKPNGCRVHILGLFLKDLDALTPVINKVVNMRNESFPIDVKKFNETCGFNLKEEDIEETNFIYTLMVKKGYANSYPDLQQMYKKYKVRATTIGVDVKEAIDSIHKAGGIAILAHPVCLRLEDNELKEAIKTFKKMGLDGMECFHRLHEKEKVPFYLSIAKELDLIVSGGSDFHGEYYPEERFGKGKGDDFLVPYEVLENMKKRL